jgi:hypothetical protein
VSPASIAYSDKPHHSGLASRWLHGKVGRCLLILLALWGIVTLLPDLGRIATPLASYGFSTDNDGVVSDVAAPFATDAASPAWQAGLRIGDRLDLRIMNCWEPDSRRCRDTLAVLAGLGGTSYVPQGMTTRLWVRNPAGSSREMTLVSRLPHRGLGTVIVLIADQSLAMVLILGAAYLVWHRPSRTAWGFFLFALWSQPGQVAGLLGSLMAWPPAVLITEVIFAMIQAAGVVGFVLLILCFPRDESSHRWRMMERSLPFIAIGLTVAQLVSFSNVMGLPTEWQTDALFLALLGINIAALVILVARRWEMPPAEYQRLRWVTMGCALGLPAFLFAKISQSTTLLELVWGGAQPGDQFIGLLFLFNCVLAWFVGIAIWRRRVENVWTPIRRGTTLFAVTVVVAVPIVYVHDVLSKYEHVLEIPEIVWALVAAPGILLLLHKVQEIAVNLTDRILHHAYFEAERRFRRADAELVAAAALEEVDRLVTSVPMEAFGLVSAAVFREEGAGFRRAAALGWDAASLRLLDPVADALPLQSFFKRLPLRLGRDQYAREGLPEGLEAPTLAVPIAADGHAVAVAVYGPQAAGSELNHDQRVILMRFARHAAITYQRVGIDLLRSEVAMLRAELSEMAESAG